MENAKEEENMFLLVLELPMKGNLKMENFMAMENENF